MVEKKNTTTKLSFKQAPDTNHLTLPGNIHDLLNGCKNTVIVLLKVNAWLEQSCKNSWAVFTLALFSPISWSKQSEMTRKTYHMECWINLQCGNCSNFWIKLLVKFAFLQNKAFKPAHPGAPHCTYELILFLSSRFELGLWGTLLL